MGFARVLSATVSRALAHVSPNCETGVTRRRMGAGPQDVALRSTSPLRLPMLL